MWIKYFGDETCKREYTFIFLTMCKIFIKSKQIFQNSHILRLGFLRYLYVRLQNVYPFLALIMLCELKSFMFQCRWFLSIPMAVILANLCFIRAILQFCCKQVCNWRKCLWLYWKYVELYLGTFYVFFGQKSCREHIMQRYCLPICSPKLLHIFQWIFVWGGVCIL